jgi:hypothetical protein
MGRLSDPWIMRKSQADLRNDALLVVGEMSR